MNVSKINMCSPSFGQVKKSAQKQVIIQAKGDIDKLTEAEDLVLGQRYNYLYDIVAANDSNYFAYKVVKRGSDGKDGMYCSDFKEACSFADEFYKDDAKKRDLK